MNDINLFKNYFLGNVLIRVIQMLNERDRIEKNEVTTMLGKIATEHNLKVKEVLKLMRSSLTGLKVCSFSINFAFGF